MIFIATANYTTQQPKWPQIKKKQHSDEFIHQGQRLQVIKNTWHGICEWRIVCVNIKKINDYETRI
jgi:hypothetical protein